MALCSAEHEMARFLLMCELISKILYVSTFLKKNEMELQNEQRVCDIIPNFKNILFKNKFCLTVYIETLVFYYLLL